MTQEQTNVVVLGGARRNKQRVKEGTPSKPISQAELLRRFLSKPDKSVNYKYDKVFIRKCDITIGIMLLNIGRLSYGTQWRVVQIKTWVPFLKQKKSVERIITHHDDVYIENIDTGDKRTIRFGSLSYQAQWRLA